MAALYQRFIGFQTLKYLIFFFFNPHVVKLSSAPSYLENWFQLGFCSELWDKIDLKEKEGSYGLAAKSENGTGLYFFWSIWVISRQPVVGKSLRTRSHSSLILIRERKHWHRTFHESSVNIFFFS